MLGGKKRIRGGRNGRGGERRGGETGPGPGLKLGRGEGKQVRIFLIWIVGLIIDKQPAGRPL